VPAFAKGQILGANTDIRVGVVGLNGQGKAHIEGFRKLEGVRVVALCDVDREVLGKAAMAFQKRGEQVEAFTDVRRFLEFRDLDAVVVATPNHWHSLITVWACQAGKDVYVEKPVSHNVWEGRQAVRAARRYERIVQTGTQARSATGIQEGIYALRRGELGAIRYAKGLCYKRRKTIGRVNGHQPVPGFIDYDLWLGPAPVAHMDRYRLHYDWHWQWPYGNGDLGNQGIHEMDLCRWALGESGLSTRVQSVGGRFGYEDDGQTPNTLLVEHSFPESKLYFEVRGLPDKAGSSNMPVHRSSSIGAVIECADGYMVLRNNQTKLYDSKGGLIRTLGDARESALALHHKNFIEAVRSRDPGHLNADIEEGHVSSALCHTANISHRLGVERAVADIRDAWKSDPVLQDSVERFAEHLKANLVDLDAGYPVLGPALAMDVEEENFFRNDAANRLLSREYREGFEVPRRV